MCRRFESVLRYQLNQRVSSSSGNWRMSHHVAFILVMFQWILLTRGDWTQHSCNMTRKSGKAPTGQFLKRRNKIKLAILDRALSLIRNTCEHADDLEIPPFENAEQPKSQRSV